MKAFKIFFFFSLKLIDHATMSISIIFLNGYEARLVSEKLKSTAFKIIIHQLAYQLCVFKIKYLFNLF